MQTGQIFPSKNGSLLKKKKEKSEAERNDKSMALSKLDELSQVIMPIEVQANFDLRNSTFSFLNWELFNLRKIYVLNLKTGCPKKMPCVGEFASWDLS